jgi:uracil phosphoribosyltransferase
MQAEMMAGGSALWFDLFVAMVEHLVSVLRPKITEPSHFRSCTDIIARTMFLMPEPDAE